MKVNPSTGPEGHFNMTIQAVGPSSTAGGLGPRAITNEKIGPNIPSSMLSFASLKVSEAPSLGGDRASQP